MQEQQVSGHPTHVLTAASRAYKLAKGLGQQREAATKIREAFVKTYGTLRGECFYSIWLEWADES